MADALATLLVQDGAVSPEALARARARQAESGGGLDTALLELGISGERTLAAALARASGLAVASPEALAAPEVRARRVFPAKVAERHRLAPFKLEGRDLSVAAAWPVDLAALDEIGFMLSLQVVPFVAPEWRVVELRQRLYGTPMPPRYAELAERLASAPAEPEAPPERPAAASTPSALPGPSAAGPADPGPDAPPPADAPPEPPAAAEPGVTLALRGEPPRWDLPAAREALAAAATRDDVVSVALHYARDFFEAAALLAVSRERLRGHDALGTDPQLRARARTVEVPIGIAGMVRSVLEAGGPYLGPPGADPVLEAVRTAMGRGAPRTVLLYPVVIRERTAAVLYADNGEAPVSPRRVGDLLLLLASMGAALERILVTSKRAPAGGPPHAALPEAWEAREPARAPPPAGAGAPLDLGAPPERFEVAPAAEALAASLAFDPPTAVARLVATERGSAERGRLLALLVQHGPEAAAALVPAFPGPSDAGGGEGAPAGERGPVLEAMAALGIVATPWLLALLADADPRRRRHAALLLGRAGDPAAFLALADRVFDADREVGDAALEALSGQRGHPDFRPVLDRLRRALGAGPPRSARAAGALGRLGDGGAVPALVALLDGSGPAAAAAAEALEAITGRRLGGDAAAWSSWWRAARDGAAAGGRP